MFSVMSFAAALDFAGFEFEVVAGADEITITIPAGKFVAGEEVSLQVWRTDYYGNRTRDWIDQYTVPDPYPVGGWEITFLTPKAIDNEDEFEFIFGATSLDDDYTYTTAIGPAKPSILITGPDAIYKDGPGTFVVAAKSLPNFSSAVSFTVSYPVDLVTALDAAGLPLEPTTPTIIYWAVAADTGWKLNTAGDLMERTMTLYYAQDYTSGGGLAKTGPYGLYELFAFELTPVLALADDYVDDPDNPIIAEIVVANNAKGATGGGWFPLGGYTKEVESVPFVIYDVNRDGSVDLADVAAAAYLFMCKVGDHDWDNLVEFEKFGSDPLELYYSDGMRCDVNSMYLKDKDTGDFILDAKGEKILVGYGDGVVDIEDIIAIMVCEYYEE